MSDKCFSSFNGYQVKDAVARAAVDEHAGDLELLQQAIEAHEANKENPHGITPEMIGALPDTWEPDLSGVGSFPAEESTEYPGCYYIMNNGVQEWINPPMVMDAEHRTIKRSKNRVVYTKLVDLGVLPSKAEKIVTHSAEAVGEVVGLYAIGRHTTSSNTQIIPYITTAGTVATMVMATATKLYIYTFVSGASEYNGWAIIEYVKS